MDDSDLRFQRGPGLKRISLDANYANYYYSGYMHQIYTMCLPCYSVLRMAAYGPLFLFTLRETGDQHVHRDSQEGLQHDIGEKTFHAIRNNGYWFITFSVLNPAFRQRPWRSWVSDIGLRIVPQRREEEINEGIYERAGFLEFGYAPKFGVVSYYKPLFRL